MHLRKLVLGTIRQHRMIPEGGRVLVAVSGGPDSVGLLHLLRDLEADGPFRVAAIVHFNHQLRGADADEDEAFCRTLAAKLELPIEVGRADVRAIAAAQGRSIEDAARVVRYGFFREAADRLGADVVAVGHTRDDQAETFLLRLLRGSGTRGLGGIRPRAGLVVRPLLELSRSDVLTFVRARELPFRQDASNLDVTIPRNRVRHELLPYLQRDFLPNIVEVLAREAALAQVDAERLEDEAINSLASVVLRETRDNEGDHRIVIDAQALSSAHPALASRMALRVLAQAARGRFVGNDAVARFLRFATAGRRGSRLSLPGSEAIHEGERIVLGPQPRRGLAPPVANSFRIPLSIPGEVVLTPQALAVSASWAREAERLPDARDLGSGFVRVAAGPLTVRSRRPGDRFQPPGLGGRTKKLQDYFVDRKVARDTRDFVPLVVDADDQIVWVVGHGFSEAHRAAGPSPGVILLTARQLGGEV